MQENKGWKFDLTLFDGDGAGAGAGAGDGGSGADAGVTQEAAAPTNPNRRRRENPLANVRYGIQPEAPAPEAPAQVEEAAPTEDDWKAAKEKFRDFYNRDTTGIVQERLRNTKEAETNLAKLAPILQGLGKKYGKEAGDLDGIIAAYTDDDSLYEEDAAKAGMSVAAYKQLTQLKADKEANEARQQQAEMQQRVNAHLQNLIAQGEKMKATFPGFDLRTEMQNPVFQRLTSPAVGVDVETAYYTVHRRELESQMLSVAAQKSQEKLSQAVASGMSRPTENGARSVSPSLEIRSDPSKWSKKDREEVKARARRGEKIRL